MRKTLATLLAVALVGAAFAGPAEAKKKKKKKKPPVPVCEEFAPGELGAEAETIVVTDEHTEEAPLAVEGATAEPGLKFGTFQGQSVDGTTGGDSYYNVQVDSSAPDAGLYVLLEWSAPGNVYDYDLFAFDTEGNEVASAHGFNPYLPFSGENAGGESGGNFEKLVGVKTADCAGYTLDVSTASGPGGAVTLNAWLGEVQYDPAAAEETP